MNKVKPGHIVRYKRGGLYPQLEGHYGLVQVNDGSIGVEWDDLSCLGPDCVPHDLGGRLIGRRATSGWYVLLSEIEIL